MMPKLPYYVHGKAEAAQFQNVAMFNNVLLSHKFVSNKKCLLIFAIHFSLVMFRSIQTTMQWKVILLIAAISADFSSSAPSSRSGPVPQIPRLKRDAIDWQSLSR